MAPSSPSCKPPRAWPRRSRALPPAQRPRCSLFLAKSPLGPWELAAPEPIFGTRKREYRAEMARSGGYSNLQFTDTPAPYQETGHKAIFEGPDGQLWSSCQLLRPTHFPIGRLAKSAPVGHLAAALPQRNLRHRRPHLDRANRALLACAAPTAWHYPSHPNMPRSRNILLSILLLLLGSGSAWAQSYLSFEDKAARLVLAADGKTLPLLVSPAPPNGSRAAGNLPYPRAGREIPRHFHQRCYTKRAH